MLDRIRDFFTVTLITMLVGGLGVWLIGAQNSVHIGASILIFGYLGFLLFRATFGEISHPLPFRSWYFFSMVGCFGVFYRRPQGCLGRGIYSDLSAGRSPQNISTPVPFAANGLHQFVLALVPLFWVIFSKHLFRNGC